MGVIIEPVLAKLSGQKKSPLCGIPLHEGWQNQAHLLFQKCERVGECLAQCCDTKEYYIENDDIGRSVLCAQLEREAELIRTYDLLGILHTHQLRG